VVSFFGRILLGRLPALGVSCLDRKRMRFLRFHRLVPESRKIGRWLREKASWVLDSLFPSEGLFSNMVCIIF